MEKSYQVVRYYEKDRKPRIMAKDFTLKKAQEWCNNLETSSITAKAPRGCDNNDSKIAKWHKQDRHWFDGYREQ